MQFPRQTTTFSLRRTLSCYSLVMAFKDRNFASYKLDDDGLIGDGEFIVLYDLNYSIMEAFSSSHSFCFCFEVSSVSDLEQLLTCSYAKFRLLKRIQCCCNVLPYLSSLRAPHSHIMFQSPLENSCLYSQLKPTWEIVKF